MELSVLTKTAKPYTIFLPLSLPYNEEQTYHKLDNDNAGNLSSHTRNELMAYENVIDTDVLDFAPFPLFGYRKSYGEFIKGLETGQRSSFFKVTEPSLHRTLNNTDPDSSFLSVTSILNFTHRNISVREFNNTVKIIHPHSTSGLKNTSLINHAVILTVYTFDNPIRSRSDLTNPELLDSNILNNMLKQEDNIPNVVTDEIRAILKFYMDNIGKLIESMEKNTYNHTQIRRLSKIVKIVTLTTVSLSELEHAENESVFLYNKNLVMSLKEPKFTPYHPHVSSPFTYMDEDEIMALMENHLKFFIVDPENKLSEKYTFILGDVYKIPRIAQSAAAPGLYVINDKDKQKSIFIDIEQIGEKDFVYNSMEEARNAVNGVGLAQHFELQNNQLKLQIQEREKEMEGFRKDRQVLEQSLFEKKHNREEFSEGIKTAGAIVAGIASLASLTLVTYKLLSPNEK